MLGHRRLGQRQPLDQLADRPLAVPQEVEDLPAARLGQHLECGCHGSNIA
jgi:hypothetical protein